MAFLLALASDMDSPDVRDLIAACWAEYPGCVYAPEENPHLEAFASHALAAHGQAWVAREGDRLAGTISIHRLGEELWELHTLYVARWARRQGLARRLLAEAEGWARERGGTRVELWSDSRFRPAHEFYRRHAYLQSSRLRALGDLSATVEYHFEKRMA